MTGPSTGLSHRPSTRPSETHSTLRRASGRARHNVLCVMCEDISPLLGSYGDPGGPDPGPRPVRARGRAVHPHVLELGRVRAEPGRADHRHVRERDRRQQHAHEQRRPRGAPQLRGGAAAGRATLPRVPARGRLLHDEQREDRLPVHSPAHRLGRERARRPLEEPPGGDALLLGLQPRDDARVPGVGPRERPGRRAARAGDPAALLPRHARRPARRGPRLQQRGDHGPAGRRAADGARGGGRRRRHDRRSSTPTTAAPSRAASGSCSTPGCACRS